MLLSDIWGVNHGHRLSGHILETLFKTLDYYNFRLLNKIKILVEKDDLLMTLFAKRCFENIAPVGLEKLQGKGWGL